MKIHFKILFCPILILFFCFSTINLVSSSSINFSDLETQITPESSENKIKKLQNFFVDLGLYNGDIDGKYETIKPYLIRYQIKASLVKDENDWGAGYFGKKTILALKKDFGDKFESSKEKIKKDKPNTSEKYFIVTAYYSPLPNQKNYLKGGYFEDIKLNGDGKLTSSGKKVFPGLLAAPRNYSFGTKIYLNGIGIGFVEDRGGAIVNSGEKGNEHDRIDIWMGYGDEGLERAISWGKRVIKGQIISDYREINIEFSPLFIHKSFFVTPESTSNNVKKLQNLFKNLNLYNGNIDGDYSNIKENIIDYQITNGIIKSRTSDYAGYFGPKTIKKFRKDYGLYEIFVKKPLEGGSKKFLLSPSEKRKIEDISDKIIIYIDKKFSGDELKKKLYIDKIKSKLQFYVDKAESERRKEKLIYLYLLM